MLVLLHGLYEVGGIGQTLMGTGIQPGEALSQKLYIQLSLLQINPVQVGDLQLAPGGRFQILCVLDDMIIVEIQPGHAVIALRLLRLFLNGYGLSFFIELHNAKTLRIIHIVAEHAGALSVLRAFDCGAQPFGQSVPRENVIAQNHGDVVFSDKFFSDNKGLREPVRRRLNLILQMQPELMSVPKQFLKARRIRRCGDNQNIPDIRIHQDRQRVIDHRFVINRQKLLGCYLCQRIKPGAGASGKNDSFHCNPSFLMPYHTSVRSTFCHPFVDSWHRTFDTVIIF